MSRRALAGGLAKAAHTALLAGAQQGQVLPAAAGASLQHIRCWVRAAAPCLQSALCHRGP